LSFGVGDTSYEFMEITTKIGCPVNCLDYCPQEVTTSRYSGKRTLSIKDWEIMLNRIPKTLPLVFSGFCEPFANDKLVDLVDMAHKAGHPISIFTTLYNASRIDVEKLVKYQFLVFCLHLPDGKAMKIPLSQEYKDNVFTVLYNVRNVSFCIMNDRFKSLNRENITRGISIKPKRFRFCYKFDNPQFTLLPNGDVSLCCMDFGLSNILGNLLTENYVDVKRRFLARKRTTFKLCSQCSYNLSPLRALVDSVNRQNEKHFHLFQSSVRS